MASRFAWLDHSESDRRNALDVVDLFCEQDTRDELGYGTVRDALADSLFPGISTIQTRAKYLLFIPYCENFGREPAKPCKGSFNVRIGPELHRHALIAAKENNLNLNEFVKRSIWIK